MLDNGKFGAVESYVQNDSDFSEDGSKSGTIRMSLAVTPDIPDKLRDLAGGRFKMGAWLCELINNLHANRQTVNVDTMDISMLRMSFQGLLGEVMALKAELIRTQSQVSAMMADRR